MHQSRMTCYASSARLVGVLRLVNASESTDLLEQSRRNPELQGTGGYRRLLEALNGPRARLT